MNIHFMKIDFRFGKWTCELRKRKPVFFGLVARMKDIRNRCKVSRGLKKTSILFVVERSKYLTESSKISNWTYNFC